LRKHNSQEHTGKDKKTCPICMVSQVGSQDYFIWAMS
jgi:hypothetical protein